MLTLLSPSGMPAAAEKSAHEILDAYIDAGGNFIDTSDSYGESQECIGRWLSKRVVKDPAFRKKLVIATKCRNRVDPNDDNSEGLSRKHIYDQIESSLKTLQTPYIDLYQVHHWHDASS